MELKYKLLLLALIPLAIPTPTTVEAKITVKVAVSNEWQSPDRTMVANLAIANSLLAEASKPIAKIKRPTVRQNKGYTASSCVSYAKAQTGYTAHVGAARNWSRNSNVPVVGGVVITRESSVGHVAVITAVTTTGIVVSEANYKRGKVTSGRVIPKNSPVILGYWTPTP